MDCSPPGSSVHGILQARIPFTIPGDFPKLGIEFMSRVSFTADRFLTIWAIREAPRLSPPDVKSWLIEKDPDPGKDWRQEEKRATEDETVGWHHQLDGHASAQTPGDREGQGSLSCCSPWGLKELDTAEWRTPTTKKQSSTTVIKLGPSTIFLALLGTYDYLTFVVIAMVKDEG